MRGEMSHCLIPRSGLIGFLGIPLTRTDKLVVVMYFVTNFLRNQISNHF